MNITSLRGVWGNEVHLVGL